MKEVGFIGLGQQGGPIAERIQAAGFNLTVWARRSQSCEDVVAKGAKQAASVAELAATCDYVAVCVVDDAGVLEICRQLIPAMASGAMLVVHSTILPESCETLAALCVARGIEFLDAPVSGGGGAAAAGTLNVMCGGTNKALLNANQVLQSFAGLIVHLGPAGAGQRAKIVNNALMAANMGLAHAALQAGEALSLDRAALANLMKASSGRSFGLEVYARLPSPRAFEHGAALLLKDVGLLASILPGNDAADVLGCASHGFLRAALPVGQNWRNSSPASANDGGA